MSDMSRESAIQCRDCDRKFATKGALKQHRLAKHTDAEPSIAEQMIEGEVNRAMGVPNEDWIEDMLP